MIKSIEIKSLPEVEEMVMNNDRDCFIENCPHLILSRANGWFRGVRDKNKKFEKTCNLCHFKFIPDDSLRGSYDTIWVSYYTGKCILSREDEEIC